MSKQTKRFVFVAGDGKEEHLVLAYNEDGGIDLRTSTLQVYEGGEMVDGDLPFIIPLEREVEREMQRMEDHRWEM